MNTPQSLAQQSLMPSVFTPRQLARITGLSYVIVFFAAIFANFGVLEALSKAPMATVQTGGFFVRAGILAFLITVVFDVVIAWALQLLFEHHPLTLLSTLFRMMHAAIMGVAIFALPLALKAQTAASILKQVDLFNTIWLIGLFFFGIHLLLLSQMLKQIRQFPLWIRFMLGCAGLMYMVDTAAHFMLVNYSDYATVFLTLVALPSMLGEMSFALWLLFKGGQHNA